MERNVRAPEPLLSLRAAVVFLISLQTAVAAGFLTYAAHSPLATAVLAGGAAFGVTVAFGHSIIG
ncbi:hypothetical protein [Streptomyces fildesensis]|uniref:hypothetical protein n=1 Tax=Streptomyces fildesensis TaxID=375757 RepID=UPI001E5CBECB|nr:hypothetical protein [Streptomyces fildesensis]